jgi:3-oxoacyl-[acyl-carrier-protein] synthase II
MSQRDVFVTGIGLVTSLGEGARATHAALMAGAAPVFDRATMAPHVIHPLVALDLDKQIPKKGDQRQMEPWQRLGVYAAGLALLDAGIAGNAELLARTHMIVAAGGGERDVAVDEAVMNGIRGANDPGAFLNERLASDLRPTLFLAQLSNLLAGNISIVHGVTGSSRTFMGEEMAGLDALRTLHARIRAGQADLGLVGAAYSAPRPDMHLYFATGGVLLAGEPSPVWSRGAPGGMVIGSAGAFLVIESREHAEARGAKAIARVAAVEAERTRRGPGEVEAIFGEMIARLPARPDAVFSGATGIGGVTGEERAALSASGLKAIRATGTRLGHAVEAALPMNVALAALAVEAGAAPGPFEPSEDAAPDAVARVLVTATGQARGEGVVLLERA